MLFSNVPLSLLWVGQDRQVSEFLRWLTVTHTQPWHAHHHRLGPGVCTRGSSSRSPWSRTSTSTRCCATSSGIQSGPIWWNGQKTGAGRVSVDMPRGMTGARQLLAAWPIPRPEDWASRVNRAESKKELEALRRSVQRGQPYGSEPWCQRIVQRLGLESTLPPAADP